MRRAARSEVPELAQRGLGSDAWRVCGVHDVPWNMLFTKASASHAPRVGCERRRARITS
jgi:hypothetical protein